MNAHTQIDRAYKRGLRAGKVGKKCYDCPYGITEKRLRTETMVWQAWHRGLIAGREKATQAKSVARVKRITRYKRHKLSRYAV